MALLCGISWSGAAQTNLIENVENGGMNRVAAEFAVEIFVHFEQGHENSAACEEKSKHCAAWPAADDAAEVVSTSRISSRWACALAVTNGVVMIFSLLNRCLSRG